MLIIDDKAKNGIKGRERETKLATSFPIGFFFVIHILKTSIEMDQISQEVNTLLPAVNNVDCRFNHQPVSVEFFVYSE